MAAMNRTERPILMSGPMVRAILEGRKSQTRRVVKPQPTGDPRPLSEWSSGLAAACHDHAPDPEKLAAHSDRLRGRIFPFTTANGVLMSPTCPYGVPGSKLWVRETFATWDGPTAYRADSLTKYGEEDSDSRRCREDYAVKWRPSIFMPRALSRITLELTAVRVERLQEISEADAEAEGITLKPGISRSDPRAYKVFGAAYRVLWDSINAKRGFGWGVNPWLWVLEFKRA